MFWQRMTILGKGYFHPNKSQEDSNSGFLVSFSSSEILFLFSCVVPIHVIRFSRSHLANGIDVYNRSNEMLQPSAHVEISY